MAMNVETAKTLTDPESRPHTKKIIISNNKSKVKIAKQLCIVTTINVEGCNFTYILQLMCIHSQN